MMMMMMSLYFAQQQKLKLDCVDNRPELLQQLAQVAGVSSSTPSPAPDHWYEAKPPFPAHG